MLSEIWYEIAVLSRADTVDWVCLLQVLDAPALQDDFYLNLVDWSTQNVLAVGLGSCVYLWSACTSRVIGERLLAPIIIHCNRFKKFP